MQDAGADQRLRRQDEADPRPEPELQREDGQPSRHARTTRTRFEFTVDSNIDDIYNKIGAGDLEDEYATASPEGVPRVLDEPEQAEVPALELGRRDVLHHDEPDPAAVRRRARSPGDELGHRPAALYDRRGVAPCPVRSPSTSSRTRCCAESSNDYHPFKTPGDPGSLAKAKAEMALVEVRQQRVVSAPQGVQGHPPDHRRACGRQADAADHPGGRREDRASPSRCAASTARTR